MSQNLKRESLNKDFFEEWEQYASSSLKKYPDLLYSFKNDENSQDGFQNQNYFWSNEFQNKKDPSKVFSEKSYLDYQNLNTKFTDSVQKDQVQKSNQSKRIFNAMKNDQNIFFQEDKEDIQAMKELLQHYKKTESLQQNQVEFYDLENKGDSLENIQKIEKIEILDQIQLNHKLKSKFQKNFSQPRNSAQGINLNNFKKYEDIIENNKTQIQKLALSFNTTSNFANNYNQNQKFGGQFYPLKKQLNFKQNQMRCLETTNLSQVLDLQKPKNQNEIQKKERNYQKQQTFQFLLKKKFKALNSNKKQINALINIVEFKKKNSFNHNLEQKQNIQFLETNSKNNFFSDHNYKTQKIILKNSISLNNSLEIKKFKQLIPQIKNKSFFIQENEKKQENKKIISNNYLNLSFNKNNENQINSRNSLSNYYDFQTNSAENDSFNFISTSKNFNKQENNINNNKTSQQPTQNKILQKNYNSFSLSQNQNLQ